MDIWISIRLYFPFLVCPFNLSPIQIYEESNALNVSSKSQFFAHPYMYIWFFLYAFVFSRATSAGNQWYGRWGKGRCNY